MLKEKVEISFGTIFDAIDESDIDLDFAMYMATATDALLDGVKELNKKELTANEAINILHLKIEDDKKKYLTKHTETPKEVVELTESLLKGFGAYLILKLYTEKKDEDETGGKA